MITGLNPDKRQVLITTTLDAQPDHRYNLAGESIVPFVSSCSVGLLLLGGGIFNPWYAVYGAGALTIALFIWFWTSTINREMVGKHKQEHHDVL